MLAVENSLRIDALERKMENLLQSGLNKTGGKIMKESAIVKEMQEQIESLERRVEVLEMRTTTLERRALEMARIVTEITERLK